MEKNTETLLQAVERNLKQSLTHIMMAKDKEELARACAILREKLGAASWLQVVSLAADTTSMPEKIRIRDLEQNLQCRLTLDWRGDFLDVIFDWMRATVSMGEVTTNEDLDGFLERITPDPNLSTLLTSR